ncbi:nuclear transport factor 2 family protein [Rhodobacteraceae bacterium DSL-40]|uniref:ester cyclase n=1 Tax=Amaricoccus sp. B4 TaxID=3368557 RepID=UPI000DAEC937
MDVEAGRNRAVVAAYVAAMNAGDFAAMRALFTEDAEIQGVTGVGGLDFALGVWRQLHDGLGMELTVEEMAAEGACVAVRYTERGRWTGPFMAQGEPTGRSYTLVAMEWFELRGGRIARRWGARDAAAQARQLGFRSEDGGKTA